jgi:hypothetical protein
MNPGFNATYLINRPRPTSAKSQRHQSMAILAATGRFIFANPAALKHEPEKTALPVNKGFSSMNAMAAPWGFSFS